jgi:hypothetical protein
MFSTQFFKNLFAISKKLFAILKKLLPKFFHSKSFPIHLKKIRKLFPKILEKNSFRKVFGYFFSQKVF